ncbi:nucleoid-associated protein [Cupriavidus campinensis]|uniref:nucleoid-associated protein n=1 Tax=Cupriavidus campinensis TaxID=151783 RepID=UPI0011EBF0B8|nr:nucleoid-associated protein [Cupriavidus campinensis]
MPFQNLNIGRIIIHEVFKRNEDRSLREPRYSNQLIQLDVEARDALQQRITNALGQSSHGVEMHIQDTADQSAWDLGRRVLQSYGNDAEFIQISQSITAKLAAAQTNKGVPGGIVVVIDGTSGHPSRSFTGVIKAEPHGGFTKREEDGHLLLQYLKDLILTPQAKLYKIGAFVRHDPAAASDQQPTAGWRAFLFDDLITQGNKLGAAQYFYETFLGLTFPSNSAFQTKQFHTLTKAFIRTANVNEEKKSDLLNALTTYLKADQTATVQVAAFSDSYLDTPELRDAYTRYMGQKNFPQQAIHKDLTEVASALKNRKLVFSHNIKLTAPADQFEDYVRIQSIDGEPDANGQVPKWTQITVRDHIRDQE